ncbi:hypothetical protein ACFL2V_06975 [Pseudomonadota bacterium]
MTRLEAGSISHNVEKQIDNLNNGTDWLSVVSAVTELTSPEFGSRLLVQRAKAFRMLNQYVDAEKDFLTVQTHAQESSNQGLLFMSLGGLLDLQRTGDRDAAFGQNLEQAREYADKIVMLGSERKWSFEKIHATLQVGLLAVAVNDHEKALGIYKDCAQGCDELIEEESEAEVETLKWRVVMFQGTALERLNRKEETLEVYKYAYENVDPLHRRDRGNAANNAGRVLLELGQHTQALEWYQRGVEAATDSEGSVLDEVTHEAAMKAIEEISKLLQKR